MKNNYNNETMAFSFEVFDTISGKPVDEYAVAAIKKFRSKHNL